MNNYSRSDQLHVYFFYSSYLNKIKPGGNIDHDTDCGLKKEAEGDNDKNAK